MFKRSPDADAASEEDTCQILAVDEDRVRRARAALLAPDVLQDVVETFKVLSHATRVGILRALAAEELCVCDLAQVLDMSVSAVSHQLRDLRRLKLVEYRSEGKLAYYSIRDPFVLALLEDAVTHVEIEARSA